MAFVKTTWIDDADPAITAAQLNRIEQGIDDLYNAAYASLTSPALEAIHVINTFQNGWKATGGYRAPYFIKTPHGIVHLVGTFDGSTATSFFAATIPATWRPNPNVSTGFPVLYLAGGATYTAGLGRVTNSGQNIELYGSNGNFVAANYYTVNASWVAEA